MASRPLPLAPGRHSTRVWRAVQTLGLAVLVGLVVGLWATPERAAPLFWRGVVPLIPILLLVHPTLWRNVCPLATLSIPADAPGSRQESEGRAPLSLWGPALLLLLLIGLRPLGLDENGPASATLLMGLGTAAVLGRRSRRKSGFCNRYCPVLAVERLYGQSPLVAVANARCDGCTRCTTRGCLDLSPEAASAQLLGPDRKRWGWLRTPLGAFAAIFPGVILAFNTLPPDPSPTRVLSGFLGWGMASGLAAILVLATTGVSWRSGFRGLGALSAALYLGFALPGAAEIWGWPAAGNAAGIAGVAFALTWFVSGGRRRRRVV